MSSKKSTPGRPKSKQGNLPQIVMGITLKPSSEDIIFEYRSYEPLCLKALFTSFKNGSLVFICNPDSFSICSKNVGLESNTYVEIDVRKALRYYCNKPYIFSFDCSEAMAPILTCNSSTTHITFSINEARDATFSLYDENIPLLEQKQIRPTIIYEEGITSPHMCEEYTFLYNSISDIRKSFDLKFNISTKSLKKLFENFLKESKVATIEKLPDSPLNFNTSMQPEGPKFKAILPKNDHIGLQTSHGFSALETITVSENINVGDIKDCIKSFSDYNMAFYIMKDRGILLEFNVSNEDEKGAILDTKSSVTACILLKFYQMDS
jgi:hypothetical protein